MKNSKHTLIALLTVLAAGTASAQSMSNQGYYGEIGYTALKIKNDNNGFDATPKLARFIIGKEIDKNLSVEGTYAFTASKDSGVVGGTSYTAEGTMFGAYLKPKMEIAKDVEARCCNPQAQRRKPSQQSLLQDLSTNKNLSA